MVFILVDVSDILVQSLLSQDLPGPCLASTLPSLGHSIGIGVCISTCCWAILLQSAGCLGVLPILLVVQMELDEALNILLLVFALNAFVEKLWSVLAPLHLGDLD